MKLLIKKLFIIAIANMIKIISWQVIKLRAVVQIIGTVKWTVWIFIPCYFFTFQPLREGQNNPTKHKAYKNYQGQMIHKKIQNKHYQTPPFNQMIVANVYQNVDVFSWSDQNQTELDLNISLSLNSLFQLKEPL